MSWISGRTAVAPEQIRALRQQLGLTQQQFGTLLGVHWTTINRWEAGRTGPHPPATRRLFALAQHAELPMDELVQQLSASLVWTVRRTRRLSQRELGCLLGVSSSTIYRWEKEQATPPGEQIARLLALLEES